MTDLGPTEFLKLDVGGGTMIEPWLPKPKGLDPTNGQVDILASADLAAGIRRMLAERSYKRHLFSLMTDYLESKLPSGARWPARCLALAAERSRAATPGNEAASDMAGDRLVLNAAPMSTGLIGGRRVRATILPLDESECLFGVPLDPMRERRQARQPFAGQNRAPTLI